MAKCVGLIALIISLQLVASAFALIPSDFDHAHIKYINAKGPYLGLISVHSSETQAFISNGAFKPDLDSPFPLSGREYVVGSVNDRRVILVKSGSGLVNAASVTQQLLDLFDVVGVVHFGIAGILDNETLSIGDVTIPAEFVNAGIWKWTNPSVESEKNDINRLHVKNFNSPKGGDNLLGHLLYKSEEFYPKYHNSSQDLTWQPVDPFWLNAAFRLEGTKLQECIGTTCVGKKPKVVVGQKASTANIFVDNSAYSEFLVRTLKVSSADKESSAVVLTSLSNGYPVIVVRGLADIAGSTENNEDFLEYAAQGAAKTVVELSQILPYAVPYARMGDGHSKLRMSVN